MMSVCMSRSAAYFASAGAGAGAGAGADAGATGKRTPGACRHFRPYI